MATAVSADGRTMAAATDTAEVALFDVAPLRFRTLLTEDRDGTPAWKAEKKSWPGVSNLFRAPPLVFSPDGALLVAAGARGELVGWNVADLGIRFRAPWDPAMVGLAFFPDGHSFVTVGPVAKLWSSGDGTMLGEFRHAGEAQATAVAIAPDGAVVLVGLSSGEIVEFAAASRESLRVLKAHAAPVTGIAFAPDGSTFVSTAGRFDPRIWNRGDGAPVSKRLVETAGIGDSLREADSGTQALMLFAWLLGTVRGFQITGAPTMSAPPTLPPALHRAAREPPQSCGPAVAFSPDGRYLAASAQLSLVSGEFQLVLADMTRRQGRVIFGIYGCSVSFTRDGRLVITGGLGAPQLWSTETGARADRAVE